MLTPETVHYGKADEAIAKRQVVLDLQYAVRPERFVNKAPKHPTLPKAVYISPPADISTEQPATGANV